MTNYEQFSYVLTDYLRCGQMVEEVQISDVISVMGD